MIEIKHRRTGVTLKTVDATSLSEANLSGANLSGADLSGANLREADLSGANLGGASLGGANLSRADLGRADLSGADLGGANLRRANLRRADLRRANLRRADLSGANLRGASLREADLGRANLSEANLSGADLSEANLSDIKFDFFAILKGCRGEIPGLRTAVVNGRIDGSTYKGDCCCLVGTIANVRACSFDAIPNITPDANRPAERWFLAIKSGDTPESNPVAKITLEWIDEFLARMTADAIPPSN